MDLQARFGLRLATLREAKGLKQLQLAKKIGVSSQYVNRLETGERAPSFKVISALAEALGVDASEFLRPDGREKTGKTQSPALAQLFGAAQRLTPADLTMVVDLVRRLGRK
jgi:transcriptional regulator with XRE-family HTH domain